MLAQDHLEQQAIHDRPEPTSSGALLDGRLRDGSQRPFRHVEVHVVQAKLELVLFDEGVLGFGHYLLATCVRHD